MVKETLGRVWILRSNPVSPDPRVEKLAKLLAVHCTRVSIVAWDRNREENVEEFRSGFTFIRYVRFAKFGAGLKNLKNLIGWQLFLLRTLTEHQESYDIIHACDFDTILPALWCKFRYHKKVIYDIFDFYADHLRNTPSWLKGFIRKVDLWAINQADALIIVDDSRMEQISKSHPRHLTVIYNSPEDLFQPSIPQNQNTFTITYVGLLQIERGILELFDVLSRHHDWSLEIAGFGGDEALIRQKAQRLKKNVHWHGRVDYHRALELSQKANVLFATYDPAIPNHRFSSPNKVFEAMMLGKPIIVSRGTNMDRIILRADCGIVVDYGQEIELEAALTRLQQNPDLRKKMGGNGRRAYEETYSWSIMSARLMELYLKLMDGSAP